jgi:hypothetical protein
MKNMAKRVSLLIGLDGNIIHVNDSGNPNIHLTKMKEAIAGLEKIERARPQSFQKQLAFSVLKTGILNAKCS